MMHMHIDRLAQEAGPRQAIAWLRYAVKTIGPGFHPDSPAGSYLRLSDDSPLFSARTAARLDCDIERALTILHSIGRDAYVICWRVQRRLLGMPFSSNAWRG